MGRTPAEHALRRGIEDEEITVLVGDDNGVAHAREDGLEDFVRFAVARIVIHVLALPEQTAPRPEICRRRKAW